MDPPANFKGGKMSSSESRIKRRRDTSPGTSYYSMKSGKTMNDTRSNTSMPRERAASPSPTLKTDWSMDPPANFKAAGTLPLDSRLLKEHHFKCPVCKSLLKDPVSISCGHNCCRDCINAFWDNCSGVYVCPQCGEASETRPVLNTNTALAEVVKNIQQAGFSPALPAQAYAGPQDVACDFCTEQRLKAVKSCLKCDVFLCEIHVRQHYTIPALQKHTLSDVTGDMRTRPSQQIQSTEIGNSGRQDQADTSQDVIKEMAYKNLFESFLSAGNLQSGTQRTAKTSRPKTRDNKDVRNLARVCSTLQQQVSGLKKSLSKFSTGKNKKTKKQEDYDYEEDYEEEDDEDGSEKDSYERSDDEERDEESDEEEDDSGNSYDEEDCSDGSQSRSDEEEDGSGNSSEEEDGSDEERGSEDSHDDEEDHSEYSDEGSEEYSSDDDSDDDY